MRDPELVLAVLITVFFIFVMVAPAGAEFGGGYTVEPLTPDMDRGIELETVLVPFWQLPPRIMLGVIALSISPLLVFPVELLFILKLFALLGYRKIAPSSVLGNLSRKKVYCVIQENPGVDFSEIARKTGIPRNTLRYHMAVLRLTNKVTMLSTSRNIRYYVNSGQYSEMEQKVLKYLHNRPTRDLLSILVRNPDLSRSGVEQELGISGAGVNWHMRRLSSDGLLAISKEGRNARYTINPDIVPFLEKYMAESYELVVPSEEAALDHASERP